MITLQNEIPVPAGHRVLVQVQKIEEKTESGLYLPETSREAEQLACQIATVEALGENAWKSFDDGKTWVEPGDKVLIASYAGFEVCSVLDGVAVFYRIVNDSDIICFVQGRTKAMQTIKEIHQAREAWSKNRPTGWKA
jgi:chaperonin GroES